MPKKNQHHHITIYIHLYYFRKSCNKEIYKYHGTYGLIYLLTFINPKKTLCENRITFSQRKMLVKLQCGRSCTSTSHQGLGEEIWAGGKKCWALNFHKSYKRLRKALLY